MTGYVRARFNLLVFGSDQLRIEPAMIVVVSHRSKEDVPLLIGALYQRFLATVRDLRDRLHEIAHQRPAVG